MFNLYKILILILQPLFWLYLLWKIFKLPIYRKRLYERYGFYKKKILKGGILIHSVSIGEMLACEPLVKKLLYKNPNLFITITTINPMASEQICSIFGNTIQHVYLPYDLNCSIKRFLNKFQPKLMIIMETELWPNLISQLNERKIPIIIANARLQEKSKIYYKKIKNFTKTLLKKITFIAAQDSENAKRFIELGFPEKNMHIIGNLKFEISISKKIFKKSKIIRNQWIKNRPVWIAASIHKKEELIILNTHLNLLKNHSNLLLIIVPRRKERFKKIKKLIEKFKLNYISLSKKQKINKKIQIIVGDTIGELRKIYGIANIAFIGGSLIKHGGHNPLEAAIYSLPILTGPYTFNFKDIFKKLKKNKGTITVYNTNSLTKSISYLLKKKKYSSYCGKKNMQVLLKNKGALKKLIKLLTPYL